MADYVGPAQVTFNSRPLLQTTNIRIRRMSNARPVKTLSLGLAGKTKGAPEVTIELASAIPVEGMEVVWRDLVFSQDTFQLGFKQGTFEEVYEVWTDDSDSNSEVDTVSLDNTTLHGRRVSGHEVG